MNANSCFEIGKDHTICEDYALANKGSDFAYAIVCDGCSASHNVDFGARVLAMTAEGSIFFSFSQDPIDDQTIINQAADTVSRFQLLKEECLDATLLTAYVKDNKLIAKVRGDGVLVHRSKTGVSAFHLELTSGAPDYLSYHLNSFRKKAYDEMKGNEKILTHYRQSIDKNGSSVDFTTFAPFTPLTYNSNVEPGDIIAVISDGINSFRKSDNTAIDWRDLIDEFTAFKNFEGEFVARRISAFKRKCIKENWHHSDDISIGAIVI